MRSPSMYEEMLHETGDGVILRDIVSWQHLSSLPYDSNNNNDNNTTLNKGTAHKHDISDIDYHYIEKMI